MKNDVQGQQVVVRSALEGLYLAAHFLLPFLPDSMATVFERLNTPPQPIWQLRGSFDMLRVGAPITAGDILFAKVEVLADEIKGKDSADKGAKGAAKGATTKGAAATPAKPDAPLPLDVGRLELRVGRVVEASLHPGAESLFVEKIDVGEPSGPRQIVSGLKKYYQLADILGRSVVVLCNIKPANMRGVESQGMVLVASTTDDSRVSSPARAPCRSALLFAGSMTASLLCS